MQVRAQAQAVAPPMGDLDLKYCESISQTKRRPTRTVQVGRERALLRSVLFARNGKC